MGPKNIVCLLFCIIACCLLADAQPPACALAYDASPEVNGVKLGMTLADFKAKFPQVEVSTLKTRRYSYKVAYFPYELKQTLPDVWSLSALFIEDRLVRIEVSFNSVRGAYQKPDLYEKAARKLGLEAVWPAGHSKLDCSGFLVEVMPDHTATILIWDKKGRETDLRIIAQAYDKNPPIDEDLRADLLAMRTRDQLARLECMQKTGQEQITCTAGLGETIDKPNTRRLETIFETYGFPDAKLVGKDGVEAYYLLLQHADALALKQKCLKGITEAFKAKVISPMDYANFIDRLLVNLGKPQVYGAYFEFKDGKMVMAKTIDLKNLDRRRLRIDLPPIAEYMKMLKDAFHMDVVILQEK